MIDHKNDKTHRSLGLAATLGFCSAVGSVGAYAATQFDPRIGLDVTWTDNIALQSDSSKRDQLVGQLKPGFRFEHDSRNLVVFADYQLQAIYFDQSGPGNDDHEVFHQGQLGMQFAAVPEWLFFDLGAQHSQTVVD